MIVSWWIFVVLPPSEHFHLASEDHLLQLSEGYIPANTVSSTELMVFLTWREARNDCFPQNPVPDNLFEDGDPCQLTTYLSWFIVEVRKVNAIPLPLSIWFCVLCFDKLGTSTVVVHSSFIPFSFFIPFSWHWFNWLLKDTKFLWYNWKFDNIIGIAQVWQYHAHVKYTMHDYRLGTIFFNDFGYHLLQVSNVLCTDSRCQC